MTIHVNIGEAKTRLSELVAAARRGEEVVVNKAGVPQIRFTAIDPEDSRDGDAIVARRMRALGMYRHLVKGDPPLVRDLKPTDDEIEDHYRKKFGPAD